jgi:GTP-binding protein
VERAGILIHLLEPSPLDGTEPLENYRAIRNELRQYNEQLCQRPEIVVVTKCELPDAADIRQQLTEHLQRDVLLISAVTGQGLNHLTRAIAREMTGGEE